MSIPDSKIREAVDKIFKEVDLDKNSQLDIHEVIHFLNLGLNYLGKKACATFHDAEMYIKNADTNKDDQISKKEMFDHLKMILGKNSRWFIFYINKFTFFKNKKDENNNLCSIFYIFLLKPDELELISKKSWSLFLFWRINNKIQFRI